MFQTTNQIWMIRMMVDKNGWSWMIMHNNGSTNIDMGNNHGFLRRLSVINKNSGWIFCSYVNLLNVKPIGTSNLKSRHVQT